jgi:hypothetical protein
MQPWHPHSIVGTGSSPVRSAKAADCIWSFFVLYPFKHLNKKNAALASPQYCGDGFESRPVYCGDPQKISTT